ncbi:MAG: hypothetical protein IT208_10390 [Chthonomonadales bacterium]|nr:hypothetical protein [Chthonomonadales bacterium]
MSPWVPRPVSPFSHQGLIVWLGAVATLAIFSFLFRENRAYRFAEHILLGLGIGFAVAATVTDILIPKWWSPLASGWRAGSRGMVALALVEGALGLLWYGLYHRRTVWLSRLVMGLTIGAGAGLAFKAEVNDKLPQVIASFKSPYVPAADATTFNNSFNNIVFVLILISVLSYFFFSFEQKHPAMRASARTGRIFLMITFGVFFGNTIMTRMSVFIERVWFLLTQWLRLGVGA